MEGEEQRSADVAAELARQYAEHQHEFLDYLAALTLAAVPKHVEVTRQRPLLGLERPVTALRLELGDYRFTLETRRGTLVAKRVTLRRGIVHRTDELPMDAWIEEVGAALEGYAQRHAEAAASISRFLHARHPAPE